MFSTFNKKSCVPFMLRSVCLAIIALIIATFVFVHLFACHSCPNSILSGCQITVLYNIYIYIYMFNDIITVLASISSSRLQTFGLFFCRLVIPWFLLHFYTRSHNLTESSAFWQTNLLLYSPREEVWYAYWDALLSLQMPINITQLGIVSWNWISEDVCWWEREDGMRFTRRTKRIILSWFGIIHNKW